MLSTLRPSPSRPSRTSRRLAMPTRSPLSGVRLRRSSCRRELRWTSSYLSGWVTCQSSHSPYTSFVVHLNPSFCSKASLRVHARLRPRRSRPVPQAHRYPRTVADQDHAHRCRLRRVHARPSWFLEGCLRCVPSLVLPREWDPDVLCSSGFNFEAMAEEITEDSLVEIMNESELVTDDHCIKVHLSSQSSLFSS